MFLFFFFNDTAPTEIYPLSLHDALPICLDGLGLVEHQPSRTRHRRQPASHLAGGQHQRRPNIFKHERDSLIGIIQRSEEHTSELQSRQYLVCRLLLEKKKTNRGRYTGGG